MTGWPLALLILGLLGMVAGLLTVGYHLGGHSRWSVKTLPPVPMRDWFVPGTDGDVAPDPDVWFDGEWDETEGDA